MQAVEATTLLLKETSQRILTTLQSNPYTHSALQSISLLLSKIESYDYESIKWKQSVLLFMLTIFTWEIYLELRQRYQLSLKKLPVALKGVITEKTFLSSKAYQTDTWNFNFISSVFNQVLIQSVLFYDFLPFAWDFASDIIPVGGEIGHSLVFAYGLVVLDTLVRLPLSFYKHFVIEERHGFNKLTVTTFVTDTLKTLFLILVIGMPFLGGFLKIIEWAGENFTFYVFVFMVSFQLFFLVIFPIFIQPLFNKFDPLEDGSLRTKINELASKLKFPLTNIFVVDGSKRSNHSNAYFYGFFKNKRIVLFDTLIQKNSEEEIVAVLAHELGHWYHSHTLQNMIIAQFHLLLMFYLFSIIINVQSVYHDFGFATKPVLIGFLLFQFIYTPVDSFIGFLMNANIRSKEFQADAFAKQLGYKKQLKSGLIKLQSENLSMMNPDWVYSMWHHSHPPLIERLQALEK